MYSIIDRLIASTLKERHLVVGVLVMLCLRPVEVNGTRLDVIINPILWFGIPLLLFIIFNEFHYWVLSVVKGTAILIFIGATLLMGLGYLMCAVDKKGYIEYVHKENSNLTITRKCFSCMMTDCDYYYYKRRKLLPYIYWSPKIDIKDLDKTDWVKP